MYTNNNKYTVCSISYNTPKYKNKYTKHIIVYIFDNIVYIKYV